MPSRVPDTDGDWYWGTSADEWEVLHLTARGMGPALPSRVDDRWVSPWEYEEECRDIRHPGRWLGPVAPPCPEGKVRVEIGVVEASVHLNMLEDYRIEDDEVAIALRTALAKGAA